MATDMLDVLQRLQNALESDPDAIQKIVQTTLLKKGLSGKTGGEIFSAVSQALCIEKKHKWTFADKNAPGGGLFTLRIEDGKIFVSGFVKYCSPLDYLIRLLGTHDDVWEVCEISLIWTTDEQEVADTSSIRNHQYIFISYHQSISESCDIDRLVSVLQKVFDGDNNLCEVKI